MPKNLLIVESPAKAKTIEKYLGKDFMVKSSYGHIRDLAKGNDGINIEKDFTGLSYFEQRYSFPNINGINKGATIRLWIKKYLAVLFLRQYKLNEHYLHQNIFELPIIPDSLSEMKKWEQGLDLFKDLLCKMQGNKEILSFFEFDELSDNNWFKTRNKKPPILLLDEIIRKVKETYKDKKINQPISEEKEEEFYEKSKERFMNFFSEFKRIENKIDFEENYDSLLLSGTSELFDKAALAL